MLPFPVIFASYLRTRNSAPRGVAPRPLPFPTFQRVNVSTFRRAPLPLRSFALFCRSLHPECFTTLLQSTASALFLKNAGVSPNNSHSGTRHSPLATSHCIQVLSAHTLTNAPSRKSLRCTSLQMPGGWGGLFVFRLFDSLTFQLFDP